jgi:hypothetical protein
MSDKTSLPPRSEAELKKERLAEALRENLKRRKSQKRGRTAIQAGQSSSKDTGPSEESKNG